MRNDQIQGGEETGLVHRWTHPYRFLGYLKSKIKINNYFKGNKKIQIKKIKKGGFHKNKKTII